jgi:D-arabinose 1-dehydrogenase-like Zn-dependent alcohol dehydrogenase
MSSFPIPAPARAVVDVIACGVCHTDLTYRDGGINDEFPFLLGHEAAGTVESVGPGVTTVDPGDFVILNWRAVCGQCRACKRGRPWYCFSTFNAEQPMTLTDGTELTPALGIGAFADKTLVHEGQCTKVDPAADAAVAGLLRLVRVDYMTATTRRFRRPACPYLVPDRVGELIDRGSAALGDELALRGRRSHQRDEVGVDDKHLASHAGRRRDAK